jgi:hypothetical protein
MVLIALWVGKSKPPMNAFLTPMVEQLSKLEREGGIMHSIPNETTRVTVLAFTMDLRAKVNARLTDVLPYEQNIYCCVIRRMFSITLGVAVKRDAQYVMLKMFT